MKNQYQTHSNTQFDLFSGPQIEKPVSNPTMSISEVDSSDNHIFYNTLNNTEVLYSNEALHDLIRKQSEKTPDKLALVFKEKNFNYNILQ